MKPQATLRQRETRMSFAVRLLSYVLPLVFVPSIPARAQEIEIGTGLVCDTCHEIEQIVAFYDGDMQTAIDRVNAEEHNPSACAVWNLAYVLGPKVGIARKKDATFHIVPILVVGVVTPVGICSVTPSKYFSLVQVDERSA
jgi:hypothetical protein